MLPELRLGLLARDPFQNTHAQLPLVRTGQAVQVFDFLSRNSEEPRWAIGMACELTFAGYMSSSTG